MTRLEKLGIDLNTVEGLVKLIEYCPRDDGYNTKCKAAICSKCVARHLLTEVPTKKRWETYNGNFVGAWTDFNNIADGKTGITTLAFAEWLEEEIEVAE